MKTKVKLFSILAFCLCFIVIGVIGVFGAGGGNCNDCRQLITHDPVLSGQARESYGICYLIDDPENPCFTLYDCVDGYQLDYCSDEVHCWHSLSYCASDTY